MVLCGLNLRGMSFHCREEYLDSTSGFMYWDRGSYAPIRLCPVGNSGRFTNGVGYSMSHSRSIYMKPDSDFIGQALQLSVSVPCGANLASEDESIHPEVRGPSLA